MGRARPRRCLGRLGVLSRVSKLSADAASAVHRSAHNRPRRARFERGCCAARGEAGRRPRLGEMLAVEARRYTAGTALSRRCTVARRIGAELRGWCDSSISRRSGSISL